MNRAAAIRLAGAGLLFIGCTHPLVPRHDGGAPDAGPPAAFSGRLSLVGGADPSGATVSLLGPDGGALAQATADPDGGYTLPNVSPGVYAMRFQKVLGALTYGATLPDVQLAPPAAGGALQALVADPVSRQTAPLPAVEVPVANELVPGSPAPGNGLFDVAGNGAGVCYLSDFVLDPGQPLGGHGTYTLETRSLPEGWELTVASGVTSCRMSIDGNAVVYLTGWDWAAGRGTLWFAPIQGTPVQLDTEVGPLDGSTAFASDGSQLAWLSHLSGGLGTVQVVWLWASNVNLAGTGVLSFGFSADGHLVLVSRTDGGSDALTSMGEGSATVTPLAGDAGTQVALTPDGTTVAFLGDYSTSTSLGTLEAISIAGGAPVPLAPSSEPVFRWSPDGKSLAFLSRYDSTTGAVLSVVPASGGPAVAVASGVALSASEFAFLPGTSGLVVHRLLAAPALEAVPLDGGAGVALAQAASGYQLTSDGAYVVYSFLPGGASALTVAVAPVDGGAPTQSIPGVAGWSVAPDGRSVALLDGAGTLSLALTAGGPPRALASGVPGGSFHFSPSGSNLVFIEGYDAQAGVGLAAVASAVDGGPAVVLNRDVAWAGWASEQFLLVFRQGTPAPLGALDGLWVTGAP